MNIIKKLFRSVCNYFKVEELPPLPVACNETLDYPLFIASLAENAGDCFTS